MSAATLQIAQIVSATAAEGPGVRTAIWLQGCPMRCPGCCNPEMLPFAGGETQRVEDVLDLVRAAKAAAKDGANLPETSSAGPLEGISLLGGEPFSQAAAAAELARGVQSLGLTVMIYSGFTLAELHQQAAVDPAVTALLAATDLLVDGRYDRDQPETERRWIGSTNQQIHFLSDRYQPDDPRWQRPNTLEIRFQAGSLAVNGFPDAGLKPLWQKPKSPGKLR